MHSATLRTTFSLPSNPVFNQFSSKLNSPSSNFSVSCELAAHKLRRLATEFQSLEPVDRVRRLLQYADLLQPFDEAVRLPENRVMVCTNQVWLDVRLDEYGRMRFRADSDSEIAKGFCSCLICVLDGAEAGEILEVRSEDLVDLNVGLPSRSRVNTWENVLISMQNRTRALAAGEKERCAASFGSYAAPSGRS